MASKYKESKNKEEALFGEDFESRPRSLTKGEKDFTGLIIGEYKIIEPMWLDHFSSFMPSPGWLCFNLKTEFYKLIPNLSLNKMYVSHWSDKTFFGLEYISSDVNYLKMNCDSFRKEFLSEINKELSKTNDPIIIESIEKYKNDIEKYVLNVKTNIDFFKTLDSKEFEEELLRVTEKYHFVETQDISSYKKCLYLIVLDEYKQFYVGKAVTSLKNRMRKHWTAKTIPGRHLWNGGFEFSRIKFDDFKILDTTRIFVCEDIPKIIEENQIEANDKRLEVTNGFRYDKYEDLDDLAKAERIVINNCKCLFCLSDRTPLLISPVYERFEKFFKIKKENLLIKHYLRLDAEEPSITGWRFRS